MPAVLIQHAVEDYDAWKPVFDEHASTRREYGSEGYRLFRVADDPDELVVLFEWDSLDDARRFFEESDVRERMEAAGVVGEPEVRFLEEVEWQSPEVPTG